MAAQKIQVNTNPNLDPDFGVIPIHEADSYMVSVSPENLKLGEKARLGFYFFLLVPVMDAHEDSVAIVREILDVVLDDGDSYEVKVCDQDDIKLWNKGTPIISFDPEKIRASEEVDEHTNVNISDFFFWLKPPRDNMN